MNKIIIDTDPGIDDAFAILMAAKDSNSEIIALTSCFGNTNIENATYNLLGLKELFKINAPVYRGSINPLMFKKNNYGDFHGINGFGGVKLRVNDSSISKGYAWDAIYEHCKQNPNEITIVTLGPLTNLAKALLKYDELASLIKEIQIMGGTAFTGNEGVYGEVNFMNDPYAAKIVMRSDAKKTMSGLDGNKTTLLLEKDVEQLLKTIERNIPELYEPLCYYINSHKKAGSGGLVINDAAAMYVALEGDFTASYLPVDIEVYPGISRGRSVIDKRGNSPFVKNTYVVETINKEKYLKKLLGSI